MKKVLTLVLACVLSAAIAVGGTLAYLTDRDSNANVFTVGNVDIELGDEDFEAGSTLLPGVSINKDVTIKNTGKTDAWVWYTYAVPTALDDYIAVALENANDWVEGTEYTTTYEGVEYTIHPVLYQTVLEAGSNKVTPVSMTAVALDGTIDIAPNGDWYTVLAGVATKLNWSTASGNPVIYVSAYGIQDEGFANVNDAYAAYNLQWTTDQGVNNGLAWGEEAVVETPTTNEELKDALTQDEKVIVVELTSDVTYDVAAWSNDAMGGASTEQIVINGNGHTITFNQTDSDWDNIVTNGAELVINDATITSSGYNDGPWNRHDLNFACDVTLNDVVSDKAIALKAGGTLNNVTIDDANTSDTYAIWIQPNGQTVTLDGCTIDMLDCTDGRGIKIDEQYVSTPAKVTLNVKNTVFKTEEKSAILVKSVAGADVNLDNVNISEVAADSTNPVWVDEASSAYADLVVVTGGTKIVEP